MLGLLTLVQLHFTASSGTSTSEFSILPNSNTPCPMRPCYTLSQVMNNSSNYFTSNTTVVFPPGHHEVSTEGQLVIQNVNNISLVGDNDNTTTIKCTGEFGLAFINITNLNISKLSFSMCGAPMSNASLVPTNLIKLIDVYCQLISYTSSIYLLYITNLTANMLNISHSRGMGLLGVNIFGVSSIQQAVFVSNTPNCVIVFLDSYSPVEAPVLNLTDSSFMFGTLNECYSVFTAAGLNVIAIQTTYHVKSYIRNVTCSNSGNTPMYDNMLLWINCQVEIQVTQLNCTGGSRYGFKLKLKRDSTNCNSVEVTSHFYMSHSYFGRNKFSAIMDVGSICVVLENITVESSIHGSL